MVLLMAEVEEGGGYLLQESALFSRLGDPSIDYRSRAR